MDSFRSQYDALSGEREGFLQQARLQSELTIPSLIPPDGHGSSYQDLYKPFQSIGAFGVNALANKLATALFPISEPFFKFEAVASQEEFESLDAKALQQLDESMAQLEQEIMGHVMRRADNAAVAEILKHLLVSGNALLYVGDERSRVYSLNDYVAVRDGMGNLLKVITKDTLSYETFKQAHPGLSEVHSSHQGNRTWVPKAIEVYTCMYLKDNQWVIQEEAAGVKLSETVAKYPFDQPPYLALRFNRLHGQSYGRAYVENLYGDLRSLENLSKAMVEGAAINSRVVFCVDPGGTVSMKRFEESPNGGVIVGNARDVTAIRVEKSADLAVTASEIQRLEARLSQAFMLSGSQRDAERVTATEIRATTQEIEGILGGLYAVLSEEFQRPYITRLITILQMTGKIPEWPKELVDVSIVTGSAGIGRGVDRDKLGQFFSVMQSLGAEVFEKYIHLDGAISRLAASYGIDTSGLVKSVEEMQAETTQNQEMAMASALGPNAISAAGQVATEQVKQQGENNGNQEQV